PVRVADHDDDPVLAVTRRQRARLAGREVLRHAHVVLGVFDLFLGRRNATRATRRIPGSGALSAAGQLGLLAVNRVFAVRRVFATYRGFTVGGVSAADGRFGSRASRELRTNLFQRLDKFLFPQGLPIGNALLAGQSGELFLGPGQEVIAG